MTIVFFFLTKTECIAPNIYQSSIFARLCFAKELLRFCFIFSKHKRNLTHAIKIRT